MHPNARSRVELLQGTLDLLMLRTLLSGPAHGQVIAEAHSAHFTGSTSGRDRLVVSGTPLSGNQVLDTILLGALNQREPSRVLSPHSIWRKQFGAERSQWEPFSRAITLTSNPDDQGAR